MRKKLKIVVIVVICLAMFFLFKGISLSKYNISSKKLEKIKNGLLVMDLFVVNKEPTSDYLVYKNMKIRNDFSDCKEEKNKLSCNNFSMQISKSYLDKFKDYNEESSKIIKKYKIKGDLDLLGKIKEVGNRSDFFKSIQTNKYTYILNDYCLNNVPVILGVDLIEGDYSGLLFHQINNTYDLFLYLRDKTYVFSFKDIDKKKIIDIVNTIQID